MKKYILSAAMIALSLFGLTAFAERLPQDPIMLRILAANTKISEKERLELFEKAIKAQPSFAGRSDPGASAEVRFEHQSTAIGTISDILTDQTTSFNKFPLESRYKFVDIMLKYFPVKEMIVPATQKKLAHIIGQNIKIPPSPELIALLKKQGVELDAKDKDGKTIKSLYEAHLKKIQESLDGALLTEQNRKIAEAEKDLLQKTIAAIDQALAKPEALAAAANTNAAPTLETVVSLLQQENAQLRTALSNNADNAIAIRDLDRRFRERGIVSSNLNARARRNLSKGRITPQPETRPEDPDTERKVLSADEKK